MHYDVILITDMSGKIYHTKPLGAYRLATELRKHNYSVKVIDWFGEWLNEENQFDILLKKIIGPNTLFIGFSTVFYGLKSHNNAPGKENYWQDFYFVDRPSLWPKPINHLNTFTKNLRKNHPHVKLVAGGINDFSRQGEYQSMKDNMDFIVHGLSDTTIIELANHLRFGSKLKYNISGSKSKLIEHDMLGKSFNFKDSQVIFQPEDNIISGETLTLETSRGCLFKCDFCSFPLIGRKKGDIDYHKTENAIIEELKRNYENYNTTRYMFVDDTFNETTEKIEQVLRARDKAGVNIEFVCYLRADLLARFPKQISLLKELGIRSGYLGIESLNLESAKAIGKGTHPEKIKEILYKIKDCWENQAVIHGSFIIGLPGDNPETLDPWINWIKQMDNPIASLGFAYLNIFKNHWSSAISSNPEKYGYTVFDEQAKTARASLEWKNKYWTSQEARNYQTTLVEELWRSGRIKLGGYDLMGLLSVGYDFNYLKNTPARDLDFVDIKRRKNESWQKYMKVTMQYEKLWGKDV
jgi:hypothetical protein